MGNSKQSKQYPPVLAHDSEKKEICMSRLAISLSVLLVLIGCGLPLGAQQSVPSTVKFAGALLGSNGAPLHGTVGVNFYIYKEEDGGTPLWMETQNVLADKNGRYSVSLGSATSRG